MLASTAAVVLLLVAELLAPAELLVLLDELLQPAASTMDPTAAAVATLFAAPAGAVPNDQPTTPPAPAPAQPGATSQGNVDMRDVTADQLVGYDAVIVNGMVTVEQDRLTDGRAGMLARAHAG